MPLNFQAVAESVGLSPKDFCFIRHTTNDAPTPYSLWRSDITRFDAYQSTQSCSLRTTLNKQYWASFVATPDARTMFVGFYRARFVGIVPDGVVSPLSGKSDAGGDQYEIRATPLLDDLVGKLFIEWSKGRNITRRGDTVHAIRSIEATTLDPPFPGYREFISNLSAIKDLYPSWREYLSRAKGIYLITCPRDGVHYVGKADGDGGFYARWSCYLDGTGGNVGFKIRDPSDYQIAILQVADNLATREDIAAMESLWIAKLQSRAMGLNRNGPTKALKGF